MTYAPDSATTPRVGVLFIEDDALNQALMRAALQARPRIRLWIAETGADGLAIAERERPRLILLDLNLPDMDGLEVVRTLRQRASTLTTPIIMVSGETTPERHEAMRAAGATGFLTKPFRIARLMDVIDAYTGS
ncbi:MAG: response regulator [Dehalococcoidia bacterium]|nr:response regulator [Dehalococcoidia bacterium]